MQIGGDAPRSHDVPSIRQSPGSSHGHTHCSTLQVPLKQPGNSQGVASHAATQTLPPAVTRHSKPGSHGQRPHGLPSPSRPEHVGVNNSPVVLELSPVLDVALVSVEPVTDPLPLPSPVGTVVDVVGPVVVVVSPVDVPDAGPVDDDAKSEADVVVRKSGSGKHAMVADATIVKRKRRHMPSTYRADRCT